MSHSPKKKAVKKGSSHVFVGACIFIVLTVYLLGSVYKALNRPKIPVDTVNYHKLSNPLKLEGVIVRDEIVIYAEETKGEAVYHVTEFEKVKKNKLILSISPKDMPDHPDKQLDKINTDIMKEQKKRTDLTLFKNEVSEYNKKIRESIFSHVAKTNRTPNYMAEVYTLKETIHEKMESRNLLLLTESEGDISGLVHEREFYEKKLQEYSKSYRSEASGIVSFYIDNLENNLNFENVFTLSKEELKIKPENVFSLANKIEDKTPLYKIIKNNTWYISGYFKKDYIENMKEGQTLKLSAESEKGTRNFKGKIITLKPYEKEIYMVLEMNEFVIDFSHHRFIEFQVENDDITGLLIPKPAIIEKSVLIIPNEYVTENGVILKNNGKEELVKIDHVMVGKEKDSILITTNHSPIVSKSILIKPGSLTKEELELNNMKTIKGVYVANSSYARFRPLGNILFENNELVIMEPNTGGIKVYDDIVSDAKNITENQPIY